MFFFVYLQAIHKDKAKMVAIKAMNLQPDEVHEIVSEVNTLSQVIAPLYTLGIWVSSINIDCSEILWHFFLCEASCRERN